MEEFLSRLKNLVILKELGFLKSRKSNKFIYGFRNLVYLKMLHMWKYDAIEEFLSKIREFGCIRRIRFFYV